MNNNFPQREWIASNDLAFAVRDPNPLMEGRALVLARREVTDWFLLTLAERMALLDLVAIVKRALDKELAPDGYNVGFDSGAAAGQTLMRAHVQFVPRWHSQAASAEGSGHGMLQPHGAALVERNTRPLPLREATRPPDKTAAELPIHLWTVHDDDGQALDASFGVAPYENRVSIVFSSGGRKRGSKAARNSDYRAGLALILARLGVLGVRITDAFLDSSTVSRLASQDRRLDLPYPLTITNFHEQRKQIGAATARVGRRPGAKGSGNPEKRLRRVCDQLLSSENLGKALARNSA